MRLNFSTAKLSISTLIIMVFLLIIVSPTMAAQAPLAAPKVTAPTNGSALSREDIQVEWNTVSGAANYAYGLRDMTTNALLIDQTPTNETGFTISAEQLIEGHQYRIWVASEDSSGNVNAGYTYITINKAAPLAAPKVTAPTNGSTLSRDDDIQVEWNTVSNAANYAYGLRDMTTNALLIDKTPTNETGFTISAKQLIEGHQYRIWVASEDSSGTDYSGYTYITINKAAPLAAPKVTAPTNGSALSRDDIQVEWNTVSDAANYAYGLRDMTTNALLIDQTPTNETGFTISAAQLIEGHQYRIWVASEDSSGNVNAGYTYITISEAISVEQPLPEDIPSIPEQQVNEDNSSSLKVIINGNPVTFDVNPIVINNRTLVPLRKIFETLGAEVQWDAATQTITATNGLNNIKIGIGNSVAEKNGQAIELDIPPQIINNRTLVPLRFVSESFGANVNWDDSTKTINIDYMER